MNDGFYKRCINIISNLKLSYEEGIARDVILNELDILEKQAEDYQARFNKAIEYIEKNSFDKEEFKKWFRCFKFKADTQGIAQDLLNILQGKSDE